MHQNPITLNYYVNSNRESGASRYDVQLLPINQDVQFEQAVFRRDNREKIKEWIGGLDLPITGLSAETLFYDEVYPQHKPYGAEIGAMLGQGGVWAHELRSEAVQLQSRGQRGNRTCCTIRPLKVDMQGSFIQVYKK